MSTHRKRSGYRSINRVKRKNYRRADSKIKEGLPQRNNLRNMSEERLEDNIKFTNSMFQQFSERLAAIENRLNYIEGHRDNEGRSDLDKIIETHQQTLKKHEEWLAICDKSIKDIRLGITLKTTKEGPQRKTFWDLFK